MALLIPKGKRNRENKLNLNEGTILCLLDKKWRHVNVNMGMIWKNLPKIVGFFFNKGVVRILKTIWIVSLGIAMILWTHVATTQEKKLSIHVQQITSGPKHHFFGYIGHGWINCSLE